MTQQDIFDHFKLPVVEIARIFNTHRRNVYQWGKRKLVPEVISLRADYMTNGALPHDPSLYGAEYSRGEYKEPTDQSEDSKQVS